MTSVVRVLKSAERDIAEAMQWYQEKEDGLGEEFLTEVDRAIARITARPEQYAKRLRDYRAALMRRFPFTIYFRIIGQEIRIAAVLHQRRGPRALTRRLRSGG